MPGSTAVLAFGDFKTATVATLGLNPSKLEFVDRAGQLLTDGARFETLTSLNESSLADAPVEALVRVVDGCRNYFHRNPYRRWFDVLESLVAPLAASYYDGTACHLDLAQWATDPTWGKLQPAIRRRLLDDGRSFLSWQLSSQRIKVLLLNGRSVVDVFSEAMGTTFTKAQTMEGPLRRRIDVVAATLPSGLRAVGWPTNLQSSFGVTREFRKRLTEIVADLCGPNDAS